MISINGLLELLDTAIESFVAKRLLRRLLTSERSDYYQRWGVFHVESLANWYRLTRIDDEKINLSDTRGDELSVPLGFLNPKKLHVTYRREDGTDAVYSPVQAYVVLTFNEHLVSGVREKWSGLKQWLYSRRKLRTPLQYEMLRVIVEVSLDDPSIRFTSHAIAHIMLGPRLAQHPERNRIYSGVEYHLRALVATGAVDREEGNKGESPIFKIGETAITELEKQSLSRTLVAREQINRYLIIMLTIVSVAAALAQAWVAERARKVAGEALETQRAQLKLEIERDARTLREKEMNETLPTCKKSQRTNE